MPRNAFVARLALDLDSGLVQLPISVVHHSVLNDIQLLHGRGAFGLVSLGRFVVEIDSHDGKVETLTVPAFVKNGVYGFWLVNPLIHYRVLPFMRDPDLESYEAIRYASPTVRPYENRGPVLRGSK